MGSFYTLTHCDATNTMLKQAKIYNDVTCRIEIVKKIEIASIHNQRENLRYYYKKNKNTQLKEVIDYISTCLDEIKVCGNINGIMLIEARAKQKYLQCFDIILNNDDYIFVFRIIKFVIDSGARFRLQIYYTTFF